jgi:peptidoglycan/LPS O-acetylase OafA/YrhL
LRALAVALVVVYHVWFGRVSGGVDVFFLISGFLLTGQLARAAVRGPLELTRRWSRMALRLLPAAVTVLLGTVLAGALLLPEGRWNQTVREVVAAALFLENWQLAADSVEYTARNNAMSVVQHFWSLSIQVQFFLVWPLLVAVIALMARGALHRLHTHLTVALIGVFAASLTYSITLTISNQPLAYFHSLTRLWEFALGGLFALWMHRFPWTRDERVAFGWTGVVGLVACGAVLPVSSVFPGFAALWPTVCGGLVLLAGTTRSRYGVDRLLTLRPVQYVGGLSYSLYLWHWPVLVLFMAARDQDEVGVLGGLAVIAVSGALAILTHRFVEQPLLRRDFGVRAAYRLAALGLAAVLAAAGCWQVVTVQRAHTAQIGDAAHPGALALVDGEPPPAPLLPAPVSVYDDWVRVEQWDCTPLAGYASDACTQPVAEPARRVVVVGDSHMQQFTGALIPLAQKYDWQITTILRGACPFSTASEVVPDEPDCLAWNAAAFDQISAVRPDAVVTLASRDVRPGLTETTPPGFVQQWWRLHDLGIPVLAVRDNPRFDFSVPDCVQQNGPDAEMCGLDRQAVYADSPPYEQFTDLPPNVTFLDISDYVCTGVRCPAEIGNILVYLDDNHISAAYGTSMASLVEDRVLAAFGR